MTASQLSNAPPLEPAFDTPCPQSQVGEEVIMTLRVQDVTDRSTYVTLDSTEAHFRKASELT